MNIRRKGKESEEKKKLRRRRDCFVKWQEQQDRFLSSFSNSKLSNKRKKKKEKGKWRWNSLFLSFFFLLPTIKYNVHLGKVTRTKVITSLPSFFFQTRKWTKMRRNNGTLINRSKILSAMWFTSNDRSSSISIHWSEDFCLFEKHSSTIKQTYFFLNHPKRNHLSYSSIKIY